MRRIVPVLTRRRGVRVVIQIIVTSNCRTEDDGVMYEMSTEYFFGEKSGQSMALTKRLSSAGVAYGQICTSASPL